MASALAGVQAMPSSIGDFWANEVRGRRLRKYLDLESGIHLAPVDHPSAILRRLLTSNTSTLENEVCVRQALPVSIDVRECSGAWAGIVKYPQRRMLILPKKIARAVKRGDDVIRCQYCTCQQKEKKADGTNCTVTMQLDTASASSGAQILPGSIALGAGQETKVEMGKVLWRGGGGNFSWSTTLVPIAICIKVEVYRCIFMFIEGRVVRGHAKLGVNANKSRLRSA